MRRALLKASTASVYAALLLTLCACGEPSPDAELDLALAEVHARIPGLMESANVRGFTIAVAERGDLVWSKAYGTASAELDRAATTTTVFEAASLGKVVLALIVLRLADQGVIDLDERLADHLSYPLLEHDARYGKLTPRLILQHVSGLPNWGGWALDPDRDPVPFIGDPGHEFGYSGEAYVALQRFAEQRAGRGLEQLFVEVAADAGMTQSSFISHAGSTDEYAQAWRDDGSVRAILVFDQPIASFSLVSTAEDLARFAAYYFQGGGLSDAAHAESLRPHQPVRADAWGAHIPQGADIAWTLAWVVQETARGRVYFHAGNNGEFRSFIAYSPDNEVAVAVMSNGTKGLSFLSEILDPLVGDITPAAVWWGYEPPG